MIRSSFMDRQTIFYMTGSPFCLRTNPPKCGYCLFPSETYENYDDQKTYLDYLRKESLLYRDYVKDYLPASVYVGGGTPNIIKAEDYGYLMSIIKDLFPRLSDQCEMTLEGIPSLFNREKLVAAKDAGFNRISIGVQQLNDELIKKSGRSQRREHVLNVMDICSEMGLEYSVDLIFGWPGQSTDDMIRDLHDIVAQGVKHITHYELNVGGRNCPSYFANNLKHIIPSIDETHEMYLASKEFLINNGFRQLTCYDYERGTESEKSSFEYENRGRNPLYYDEAWGVRGNDIIGLGYGALNLASGIPCNPGWIYLNHISLADYYKAIDHKTFPVLRGHNYTLEDMKVGYLFQRIQSLFINIREYNKIFSTSLFDDFKPVWVVLKELGWISVDDGMIRVIGDGGFFSPIIQGLIAQHRKLEIASSETAVPNLKVAQYH
jgi:oxygen-independent coproporphyrinogen-3 oxidase